MVEEMTKPESEAEEVPRQQSLLELTNKEARTFLLKAESYCSIDLPAYFVFGNLISEVDQLLDKKQHKVLCDNIKPREKDDVNFTILNNKDGKYDWRPFQLIHPAIYVSLVHKITDEKNWAFIRERFEEFSDNKKIRCLSIPVVSLSDETDKAKQVSHWWTQFEQKSIELALDYESLLETDISDCYGAIYTHTIAWALHTKKNKKKGTGRKILPGKTGNTEKGRLQRIPGTVACKCGKFIFQIYTHRHRHEQRSDLYP